MNMPTLLPPSPEGVASAAAPSSTATSKAKVAAASAASVSTSTPAATAERPVVFNCEGEALLGVLHLAQSTTGQAGTLGLVIVVGGPQVRAGSHRQFVQLARVLAVAGHATLRFDVRGMGDSSGAQRSFEQITADIGVAIDTLMTDQPQLRGVVLWGLCDGASAALLYLQETQDARVCGVALANPWVRSPHSQARAQVKHYYTRRLRETAFWRKLLNGAVSRRAIGELLGALLRSHTSPSASAPSSGHFQDRMLAGWTQRARPILLLLSDADYTAREFVEHTAHHPGWQAALGSAQTQCHELIDADHTFSSAKDSQTVARLTVAWLDSLPVAEPTLG